MSSLVQLVHMERPDPRGLTSRQLWRAWVEMPTRGQGIVVTEEGVVGGSYRRVEIGKDKLLHPDPVRHLLHVVQQKREDGWKLTMFSTDERIDDEPAPNHLYQFKGAKALQKQQAVCLEIIEALDTCGCEKIDWITPETLAHLKLDSPPDKWSAEVQIGRERITLQTGHRNQVILSAKVPVGSVADQLLMVLAAGKLDHLVCDVGDDDAAQVDPAEACRAQREKPEWWREFAYKTGAQFRPIEMAPLISPNGAAVVPVLF